MVNRFSTKLTFSIASLLLVIIFLFMPASRVGAQTYRFTIPTYEVEAYLEADGSLTLRYLIVFENDPSASPLDFVDLALPYANYNLGNIEATINGQPMPEVNDSAYVNGAELALKEHEIQPGQSGTVEAWVYGITDILFPYDADDRENYVNFEFEPNFFDSDFDKSTNTAYRMTIILPPDVGSQEGVYYIPDNWPGEDISEASLTTDNRVYYSWYAGNADVHSVYRFGSAFPASAVPANSIANEDDYTPPAGSGSGGIINAIGNLCSNSPCLIGGILLVVFSIISRVLSKRKSDSRKLNYLPPKMSVVGNGIKRGLTAVEAGILLEEPLDKVLTMILFGLLKKEAVTVVNKDPMKIKGNQPMPEDLHTYEKDFIEAFEEFGLTKQRNALQSLIIALVKEVEDKMKGFNADETKAYYKDIVRRAWLAVEGAETPEIKSAQFDHTLEWTMLDDKFNDRTQQTFVSTPVILPRWWWLYNPGYSAPSTGGSAGIAAPAPAVSGGGSSKPSFSMPNIPGSDFAASIVNGATAFSSGIVGNLTGFTSGVTARTNPIPVSRSTSGSSGFRGGGGGSSCACACACAGCACACAGGGR